MSNCKCWFLPHISCPECEPQKSIELEIEEEDFLQIAIMAHERDITFNDMVVSLLMDIVTNQGGCPHNNTSETALWGTICRDCHELHIEEQNG
jgi:hypothetical protein